MQTCARALLLQHCLPFNRSITHAINATTQTGCKFLVVNPLFLGWLQIWFHTTSFQTEHPFLYFSPKNCLHHSTGRKIAPATIQKKLYLEPFSRASHYCAIAPNGTGGSSPSTIPIARLIRRLAFETFLSCWVPIIFPVTHAIFPHQQLKPLSHTSNHIPEEDRKTVFSQGFRPNDRYAGNTQPEHNLRWTFIICRAGKAMKVALTRTSTRSPCGWACLHTWRHCWWNELHIKLICTWACLHSSPHHL